MALVGVQEARQWQAERLMHERQPRHAGGDRCDAVIAHGARDDLALFGLAARALIHPGQFDVGVVGLRAGAGEQYLAHMVGQDVDQPLAELDLLLMGIAGEGVKISEFMGLLADRIGDLVAAIPGVDAKQRRHRVDIGIALAVCHIDAVARRYDVRAGFDMFRKRREGVYRRVGVHLLEIDIRYSFRRHGFPLSTEMINQVAPVYCRRF